MMCLDYAALQMPEGKNLVLVNRFTLLIKKNTSFTHITILIKNSQKNSKEAFNGPENYKLERNGERFK